MASQKPIADPGNERLRLILNSALDAIVTIDARGRFTDWNHRSETLFGWSSAEAMGKSMTELFIPHRFREAHERGMSHFLATGNGLILTKRIELPALHRDGREFPVELTVAPARVGETWIFCSFLRDLTESKAAQNRLNLQYAVTRNLAESDGMGKAAPELLKAVFKWTSWEVGSIWILADEGASLQCPSSDLKDASPALTEFVGKTWVLQFPAASAPVFFSTSAVGLGPDTAASFCCAGFDSSLSLCTICLRQWLCEESTPEYSVTCRRGGGTIAENRASKAFIRCQTDAPGSILPRPLELQFHAPVRQQVQPFIGQGRPKDVAAEHFAALDG